MHSAQIPQLLVQFPQHGGGGIAPRLVRRAFVEALAETHALSLEKKLAYSHQNDTLDTNYCSPPALLAALRHRDSLTSVFPNARKTPHSSSSSVFAAAAHDCSALKKKDE